MMIMSTRKRERGKKEKEEYEMRRKKEKKMCGYKSGSYGGRGMMDEWMMRVVFLGKGPAVE